MANKKIKIKSLYSLAEVTNTLVWTVGYIASLISIYLFPSSVTEVVLGMLLTFSFLSSFLKQITISSSKSSIKRDSSSEDNSNSISPSSSPVNRKTSLLLPINSIQYVSLEGEFKASSSLRLPSPLESAMQIEFEIRNGMNPEQALKLIKQALKLITEAEKLSSSEETQNLIVDTKQKLELQEKAINFELKVKEIACKKGRLYLKINGWLAPRLPDVEDDFNKYVAHSTNYEAIFDIVEAGGLKSLGEPIYFNPGIQGQGARSRILYKPGLISLVFDREALEKNGVEFSKMGELTTRDFVSLKCLIPASKSHLVETILSILEAKGKSINEELKNKLATVLGYTSWQELEEGLSVAGSPFSLTERNLYYHLYNSIKVVENIISTSGVEKVNLDKRSFAEFIKTGLNKTGLKGSSSITRREFLKKLGLTTVGLVISSYLPSCSYQHETYQKNVFIFIFDTGIDFSFVSDNECTLGDGCLDPLSFLFFHQMFHGTLMSRIIREECKNCNIYSIRVVDELPNNISFRDNFEDLVKILNALISRIKVIEGLITVLAFAKLHPTISVIINMSIGNHFYDKVVHDLIKQLYENGVIIVAVAGNDDTNIPVYPAAYPETIAVADVKGEGVLSIRFRKAACSNFGTWIDLAAPGDLSIEWISGEYPIYYTTEVRVNGTSIATARVTGKIAELISTGKAASAREAAQMVLREAEPVDDYYYKKGLLGRGVIKRCKWRIFGGKYTFKMPPTIEIFVQERERLLRKLKDRKMIELEKERIKAFRDIEEIRKRISSSPFKSTSNFKVNSYNSLIAGLTTGVIASVLGIGSYLLAISNPLSWPILIVSGIGAIIGGLFIYLSVLFFSQGLRIIQAFNREGGIRGSPWYKYLTTPIACVENNKIEYLPAFKKLPSVLRKSIEIHEEVHLKGKGELKAYIYQSLSLIKFISKPLLPIIGFIISAVLSYKILPGLIKGGYPLTFFSNFLAILTGLFGLAAFGSLISFSGVWRRSVLEFTGEGLSFKGKAREKSLKEIKEILVKISPEIGKILDRLSAIEKEILLFNLINKSFYKMYLSIHREGDLFKRLSKEIFSKIPKKIFDIVLFASALSMIAGIFLYNTGMIVLGSILFITGSLFPSWFGLKVIQAVIYGFKDFYASRLLPPINYYTFIKERGNLKKLIYDYVKQQLYEEILRKNLENKISISQEEINSQVKSLLEERVSNLIYRIIESRRNSLKEMRESPSFYYRLKYKLITNKAFINTGWWWFNQPTLRGIVSFIHSRVILYIAGGIIATSIVFALLSNPFASIIASIPWLYHFSFNVPFVGRLTVAGILSFMAKYQLFTSWQAILHTTIVALLLGFYKFAYQHSRRRIEKKAKKEGMVCLDVDYILNNPQKFSNKQLIKIYKYNLAYSLLGENTSMLLKNELTRRKLQSETEELTLSSYFSRVMRHISYAWRQYLAGIGIAVWDILPISLIEVGLRTIIFLRKGGKLGRLKESAYFDNNAERIIEILSTSKGFGRLWFGLWIIGFEIYMAVVFGHWLAGVLPVIGALINMLIISLEPDHTDPISSNYCALNLGGLLINNTVGRINEGEILYGTQNAIYQAFGGRGSFRDAYVAAEFYREEKSRIDKNPKARPYWTKMTFKERIDRIVEGRKENSEITNKLLEDKVIFNLVNKIRLDNDMFEGLVSQYTHNIIYRPDQEKAKDNKLYPDGKLDVSEAAKIVKNYVLINLLYIDAVKGSKRQKSTAQPETNATGNKNSDKSKTTLNKQELDRKNSSKWYSNLGQRFLEFIRLFNLTGCSRGDEQEFKQLIDFLDSEIKILLMKNRLCPDSSKIAEDLANIIGVKFLNKLWEEMIEVRGNPNKEYQIIKTLAKRIVEKIKYHEGYFELDKIVKERKADCLGYTQLYFMLMDYIGIDLPVGAIEVTEFVTGERNGHVACLVTLSDGRKVIVNGAVKSLFISKPFMLEKEFEKVGNYWELKRGNETFVHRRFRILGKGRSETLYSLVAGRLNRLGCFYFDSGKYSTAILNFKQAIELDPEYVDPYINLGNVYCRLRKYSQAIRTYREAIALDPKDDSAYYNLGLAYIAVGKYEEAIKNLKKAGEINPMLKGKITEALRVIENTLLKELKGVLEQLEQDDSSLKESNKRKSSAGSYQKAKEKSKRQKSTAQPETNATGNKNSDKSKTTLNKQESDKKDNSKWEKFLRFVSLLNPAGYSKVKEQDKQLIEALDKQIEKLQYTDSSKIARDLANIIGVDFLNKLRKEYSQAKKNRDVNKQYQIIEDLGNRVVEKIGRGGYFELDDVIKEKSTNCLGYTQLYFILGRYIGLSAEPIEISEMNRENIAMGVHLHVACLFTLSDGRKVMVNGAVKPLFISEPFVLEKEFKKVGNWWEIREKSNVFVHRRFRILDKDGLVAGRYIDLGLVYDNLGRRSEAIQNYRRAISLDSEYALAYYNLGVNYVELKKYSEAVKNFKYTIELNPKYAPAYYNLGVVYHKLERYPDAIESFKQAIEYSPEYAKAHYNLGMIYSKLGRHFQSIESFTQAIKINPKYAEAYFYRGCAYGKIRNFGEAKRDIVRALRLGLDPDLKRAAEMLLRVLKSLKLDGLSLKERSGADSSKLVKDIEEKHRKLLKGANNKEIAKLIEDLSYTGSFQKAEDLTQTIGASFLNKLKIEHTQAKQKYETVGRLISLEQLVEKEYQIIKTLAERIVGKVKYYEDYFELDKVIKEKKADCLGYTQLYFILGHYIGFSVEPVEVTEVFTGITMPVGFNHIACLFTLSDGRKVMVNGAVKPLFISEPFVLEKEFKKVGNWWEIKKESRSFLPKRFRILDGNGLVASVYNNLGETYRNLGKYPEAINIFVRGVLLDPQNASLYNNLGSISLSFRRFDEAVKSFEKAIEKDSKYALAYNNLGVAYLNLERYSKAIKSFKQAIKLYPKFAGAYFNQGLAYSYMKDFQKAKESFKRAVELDFKLKSKVEKALKQLGLDNLNLKERGDKDSNLLSRLGSLLSPAEVYAAERREDEADSDLLLASIDISKSKAQEQPALAVVENLEEKEQSVKFVERKDSNMPETEEFSANQERAPPADRWLGLTIRFEQFKDFLKELKPRLKKELFAASIYLSSLFSPASAFAQEPEKQFIQSKPTIEQNIDLATLPMPLLYRVTEDKLQIINPAVRDLQQKLEEIVDFDLPVGWKVDGVFGWRTFKVVCDFQRAQGIKADGIVGPQTWGKIYEVLGRNIDKSTKSTKQPGQKEPATPEAKRPEKVKTSQLNSADKRGEVAKVDKPNNLATKNNSDYKGRTSDGKLIDHSGTSPPLKNIKNISVLEKIKLFKDTLSQFNEVLGNILSSNLSPKNKIELLQQLDNELDDLKKEVVSLQHPAF
ncbi:MAG: tetratricopeptide repeat protein, partial [Candidatus Omnitrophica bacterium]|nr:tetratricopeptide repeat protein [Candidatus Omnitrophota bacterium]